MASIDKCKLIKGKAGKREAAKRIDSGALCFETTAAELLRDDETLRFSIGDYFITITTSDLEHMNTHAKHCAELRRNKK